MKALAIAATAVFGTLALGTAWLAHVPGSEESEPVAILQIEPAPESPSPQSVSAPESTLVPAAADFPPGISVLRPLRTTTE